MLPSVSYPAALAAGLLFLNGASATLDPIVIKGSKFFFKTNGTQFYIKGIAYQAGVNSAGTSSTTASYSDPLSDATICARDIPLLQKAGANVIRTYALDPTVNHDDCMNALDAAGIYVISDLSEPSTSIDQTDPSWDLTLYDRYTAVVDNMQKYDNVIGFFAGNEVTNNVSNTAASAFVKAAVRDTKAYIASKGYRAMGVGYAADDDATVRSNVASYLNCGDASTSIDFWGYNIYEWCGDSNFVSSGYINRTEEFKSYNVPVFFAEYGCNQIPGGAAARPFTEVQALYGENMTGVFSGGIVFEYFEETNDFGLATVDSSGSVSTLADYNAWKTQIANISPTIVTAATYSPTNTAAQSCPAVASTWAVAPTGLPPTPDANVCGCMVDSLTCTASSSLSADAIGELFGTVCGLDASACAGINKNTTIGEYGAFSMCNNTQKLSNVLNAYYLNQNSAADACDFSGQAQVVKASAAGTCAKVIASATSAAAAGSTGSSGNAASSSTKNSEGISTVRATIGMGAYAFVGYAVLAVFSGVGMLLL